MEYIAIGTVVNTHGIKGAVTVKTDSDFKDDRYKTGNRLFINARNGRLEVTVKHHSTKKNLDILTFEEFDNINDVEAFKGCALEVAAIDREPLEDDEYYASELIGAAVFVKDTPIGVVRTIRHYPQGEILVVEREGKKDVLVPFRKEFIVAVKEGRIDIDPPEGLL